MMVGVTVRRRLACHMCPRLRRSPATLPTLRFAGPSSTRQVGSNFVRDQFRCDASGNPLPVNASKQQDQTIGAACFKIPQALIFAPMQKFFQTYSPVPNLTGDLVNNFAQSRPSLNDS